MQYWDSSALVSLFVAEDRTANRLELLRRDPEVVTWWGSSAECAATLHRLRRDRELDSVALRTALDRLRELAASWIEMQPTERLRQRAIRLVGVHRLRVTDAFQLAAALLAADEDPRALAIVSNDLRLSEAAEREGFTVR